MIDQALPNVPDKLLDKWQEMINLLARLTHTPAVLITHVQIDQISVFLKSNNDTNPFASQGFQKRVSGHYCDRVVATQQPLLIKNAKREQHWQDSPALEKGMQFYLGLPLVWPNQTAFGTICIMDLDEDNQALDYLQLMEVFQSLINHDLKLLMNNQRQHRQQKLTEQQMKELDAQLAQQSNHLAETNTALRVLLRQREAEREIVEQETQQAIIDSLTPFIEQLETSLSNDQQRQMLCAMREQLIGEKQVNLLASINFSATEKKIIQQIKSGSSSKAIAELLFISKKTVDFHRQNIRKKLGLTSSHTSLNKYLIEN